ncbi:hypothetical protein [Cohnella sp. JJ-181]|uniref:hypothetical protein n=1 Tax=Cohnella rhizoplanae TaxID=2974897 RepID=UPI0022FF6393|nr:hypothetical protein [Cohnella sp. JJ-181]CAI6073060.1 hypothetical protein COHCIP112018_02370 [Cohnella sp. JJ-181]
MEQPKIPFEKDLLEMNIGDEMVLFIKGRIFVVRRGNEDDIETTNKGLCFIGARQ